MESQTQTGNIITQSPIELAAYKNFDELPEFVEKKEAITTATIEIVERFDIDPLLFDDPSATFIMASIANRWSQARTQEEWEFLHDAVTLLAHRYSGTLTEAYTSAASPITAELPPEEEQRIYDSYTNKELTEAINAQKDVVFARIKNRIGITAENEDDYEIVVLNIATESSLTGLPVSISEEDYTNAEQDRKMYKNWKSDLLSNATELEKELKSGTLPVLWATKKPGSEKRLLCLDLPTGERLLYEDIDRLKGESEDGFVEGRLRLQSLAEHEYVHTQGGMSPDMEHYFGIGLEERRAEYFSGDKNGYHDIKRFLSDVEIVTGLDFKQIFDSAPKGGKAADVYMKIAQTIGLSATLELLMTYPNSYIQHGSNGLMKATHEYLGGFDGFISRQLATELGKSRAEEIDIKLHERAKLFVGKEYLAEQMKAQGNNVLTDLVLVYASDKQ